MIPGIVGSGSWATALAKLLTDNGNRIHWCLRHDSMIEHLRQHGNNPNYLSTVEFNPELLALTTSVEEVVRDSDFILIATPSSYVIDTLSVLKPEQLAGKKILSAVKGILPQNNLLLNDYLKQAFDFPISDYYTVMGPCHAEEVAAEKLSYLTFSGLNLCGANEIAAHFKTRSLNTVQNDDVIGVQYAAVLKNIYALGAGIAHGLEYGDNFLSVLIANCADEMAGFLRKVGIKHIEVGVHEQVNNAHGTISAPNYAASVYLGDLLVTCYSLFSRNRTFGNMIGKGYSVKSAQLELNMVAEGYNASKCIFQVNAGIGADMPIAETIYKILWEKLPPAKGFKRIEAVLI